MIGRAIELSAAGYVVHAEYTTDQLVRAVPDAHHGRQHLSRRSRDPHLSQPAGR